MVAGWLVASTDEQNQLTWASSASGTVPCGGSNTARTLSGSQYTASYSYDAYDRLTSGPQGGYTYGDSAHLDAVTQIGTRFPADVRTFAYDAAGNMTCRAPSSNSTCSGTQTGAQLGYDNEGQLTTWQNAPTSPNTTDGFLYDGEGNRVAQQVTTGLPGSPSTTTTVYVGNLEEVATTGSSSTTTTYYYAGGSRIALAVGGVFTYLGTDALGSLNLALDANGNVQAAQLYDPYGGVRYNTGTMPGSYGFAGQRADNTTGLDYFNARYYDPLAGQFISADTTLPDKGTDPWGLSRYAYVEGNPLVRLDPSGHNWFSSVVSTVTHAVQAAAPAALAVLDATTGIPSMLADVHTVFFSNASPMDKIMAGADLLTNVAMDASMVVGVGEGLRAAYVGVHIAEHVAEDVGEHALEHAGEDAVAHTVEHEAESEAEHASAHTVEDGAACAYSFAASTLVAIPGGGEQPIASLKTGDQVLAYDPASGKASTQTVTATSLHHDDNLVDIILRVSVSASTTTASASAGQAKAPAGKTSVHAAPATGTATTASSSTRDEVVHTTTTHPWLTADHGWMPASFLHLGEPVQRADGTTATVAAIRAVPGAAAMWDLTVSNVHTFTVGAGEYVVHNCPVDGGAGSEEGTAGDRTRPTIKVKELKPIHSRETIGPRPDLESLSDDELLEAVNNPADGQYITINDRTGRVVNGNARTYELQDRAADPNSAITPDTEVQYQVHEAFKPWDWER